MKKGTVKWFNNEKGYGFLTLESSGEDVFIHYSEINMDGYRTLKTGQKVCFEMKGSENGLKAKDLNILI